MENKISNRAVISVTTVEQLKALSGDYLDIRLDADLDLENIDWTPLRLYDSTFDGNGHVISNLKIDLPDQILVGLFANIQNVRNLTIKNVDIVGRQLVGAICGENIERGYIENCHVIGYGSVKGERYVGGLVGIATGITIIGSSCTIDVEGTDSLTFAGGLLGGGNQRGSTITSSFTTGNVRGISAVGGLIGNYWMDGSIYLTDCEVYGLISGNGDIGGFIGAASADAGWYYRITITRGAMRGHVSGNVNVGEFVGLHSDNVTVVFVD